MVGFLRHLNLKKIIIPLFTIGSIYSTNASGVEQMPVINLTGLQNPNWPEANQLAIYISQKFLWQQNCHTDLSMSRKRTNNNSAYSKYPQKFIYTHS